jgi:arylsulfatase A-like enzyme
LAWTALAGASSGLLAYLCSLRDYGVVASPNVSQLVREHYLGIIVSTNLKLAALLALAGAFWGSLAGAALAAAADALGRARPTRLACCAAGAAAFALVTAHRFASLLLEAPGTIATLWPYEITRLDLVYDHASPALLTGSAVLGGLGLVVPLGAVLLRERPRTFAALARENARSVSLAIGRGPFFYPTLSVLAFLAPLVVLPSREPLEPARPARPNFLVLMSDALREDRVEAWREGEPVMPHLAGLAARGTFFRSCFVPTARTTESLAALMTGCWPQEHGIRVSWPRSVHMPVAGLPAVLRAQGYETMAMGDWTATELPKLGFGFERSRTPPESWSLRTFVSRGGRATALLVSVHIPRGLLEWLAPEIAYYPGVEASGLVRAHVEEELDRAAAAGRPFFMTVFTANTHEPFSARGEEHRRFTGAGYHGKNRYGLWARTIADALAFGPGLMDPRDLEQLKAVYDAAARTFDDDVGALLERLARLGIEKNTIVLVFSDHGTAFYERGSFGHGNELVSDVANRIPLVVYDPRERAPVHRVDHVVRSIDVAPLVLDLASVARPASMEGVSLRPYIEKEGTDLGLVAYGETGLWISKQTWQEDELDFGFPGIEAMCQVTDWATGIITVDDRWLRLMIRAQQRMLRDDRWKLVYVPTRHGFMTRLYDVRQGDGSPDLASVHPEIAAHFLERLAAWLGREDASIWRDPLPPPGARRLP